MKFTSLLLASLMAVGANADCYMQNPRGSNNRLNEANAKRDNDARLFDSQNNNRGGYNACDSSDATAFATVENGGTLRPLPADVYGTVDAPNANIATAIQYPMMFYEGSVLQMEWAVQHGCGGNEATDPNKLNCNMVIQYVCDADVRPLGALGAGKDLALSTNVASGLTTGNNNDNVDCENNNDDQAANVAAAETDSDDNSYGRHESHGWYCECQQRKRNQGLFVADQNLAGDAAIYTRQNAGGARSGLECAEERDYYPYWSPTPFRDLAYLTDDVSRCDVVRQNSQNVMAKQKCVSWNAATGNQEFINGKSSSIEKTQCETDGGTWATYAPWGLPEPDCQLGKFSRPNYLGNGRGDGVSPTTLHYNATLPAFANLLGSEESMITGNPVGAELDYIRCAIRLRYNVSTDDYDPWNTDASANGAAASPITGNPVRDVGASQDLKIALNTDQYGRTFQDRSHAFYIRKAAGKLGVAAATGSAIHNLNVRGKRGNIVETYPAVEYDFVPTNLNIAKSDFIHLQWCGSLTHDNGDPGEDGQTGNAGEGEPGTDKHNLVQMLHFDNQYPVPYDKVGADKPLGLKNLFGDGNMCHQALDYNLAPVANLDCALRAATAGLYLSAADPAATDLNATLDNTPAGTRAAGQLIQVNADVGTAYMYMSTRNNNFTNRGQKGVARVTSEAAGAGAAV